jgi:hypothetical protein
MISLFLGRLVMLSKSKGFDRLLLILLLPSGEAGWDKWKLITLIESMSSEHPINVISESISSSDIVSESFIENIANRIREKVPPLPGEIHRARAKKLS